MPDENGEDAALFESRVGTQLREVREGRELSLDDIARATRIPRRHLENIENGDYDKLPAPTYSTGFVKAYARELELDENAIGQSFREEIQYRTRSEASQDYFEPADPARVPPRMLAWTAAAIALILAILYGLWRSGAFGDGVTERAQLAAGTDQPTATAPEAHSGTSAPAARTPVAAEGPVVLEAEDTVWVRVYERASGDVLYEAEMQAGDRFEVPAAARSPAIRTGRAEALRITVGGRRVPQIGPAETILDDVSLAPADLVRPRTRPAPAE